MFGKLKKIFGFNSVEKKIFKKKFMDRKLKLWLYNQYKEEETDSGNEEIIVKENITYEMICDMLNNIKKYVKVENGLWENKFLIYNEKAKEEEPYIVGIFKDMYACCVFFYVIVKEGKYVVKNKWFDYYENV